MQRTRTASQVCSIISSWFCLTPFQLRPPLLNYSQIIWALVNSSQSCSISSHLSSTPFTSLLFFSTLFNDSHLYPPRLNSSRLVSTLLISCHLFNSSHLFSPSQLWPILLNSSHLCHRDAYTQRKLLHGEAFACSKLLLRDALTYGNF